MSITEGWAIVELMGHRVRAGRISEVEAFGAKLLRIDIPTGPETYVTESYGGSAIYALRPVAEQVARDYAEAQGSPNPIQPAAYRDRPALTHAVRDEDGAGGGEMEF